MAGSSSSERSSCMPPADFQLSAEDGDDDDDERLAINLLKCPLCHNGRRSFYCKQCVQRGDFIHSVSVYSERFIDKQQRLTRLKAARNQLEERCTKALEKHKQRDKLICDINACKERVRLLKHIENKTRQNITEGHQRLKILKEYNTKVTLKLPRHEEQIEKNRKYLLDVRARQQMQKDNVERKKQQLKKVIREAVKQLVKYIFPLSKVETPENSDSSEESPSESTDLVSYALADALNMSYVRGKWVNDGEHYKKTSNNNNTQEKYRIIQPTLPGTGDYSAYSFWVARNKDEPVNKENVTRNPAHNITAALAYATQLVNVLAYYLNLRLPYKLAYSEFYGSEMSDQKFSRKVARLNSNILYLCLTQHTKPSLLHPKHTLQNLMHLLDTEISDLGRIGPIEIDPSIVARLYSKLIPDLENRDGSISDEDEDAINWGWEAVPNIACPEMDIPIPPGAMATQQTSNAQVNQSVAGGLVTSAAASIVSIWRGWTTNK